MIIFKTSINYLKRVFTNGFLLPLIMIGSLIESFLMNSNMSSLSDSITNSISGKYTEVIVVNSMKKTNITQLLSSATMAYFLLLTGLIMIGINISDRKNKTLMRVFSTPVIKPLVILGNLLAQSIVAFIFAAFYIISSSMLFKVDWGNSYFGIFVVTLISVYVSVALAFLMSGLFKNPKIGISTATFIFFFFALLSDSFSLGGEFEATSKYVINKWIYDSYYNLMQGNSLRSISTNLVILFICGTVLNIIGLILYRREKTYE